MTAINEKFTFLINDMGLEIISDQTRIQFTPLESLMLLDILKAEEARLKHLAENASPMPMKITLKS